MASPIELQIAASMSLELFESLFESSLFLDDWMKSQIKVAIGFGARVYLGAGPTLFLSENQLQFTTSLSCFESLFCIVDGSLGDSALHLPEISLKNT